jgi:hypothetical protein
MAIPTNTDVGASGWRITDDPTELRIWGTKVTYPLPANGEGTIGAAEDCWLQLHDPSGRVSRRHARLTRNHEGRWGLSDLQSKNGVTQDGALQVSFPLMPGIEIGIGGLTLVVGSPWLGELRELLMRVLGWGESRCGDVDLALRAVRLAATRREPLQLCGDEDFTLVSTARLLHRHALGDERAFVLCGRRPRRTEPDAWARYDSHARYEAGDQAVPAAVGGTLCIWPRRYPHDFERILETHRDPASRFQLIVCARTPDPLIASKIVIPPIDERASELEKIIDGYAADVGSGLRASDREWIRTHGAKSLAKIEDAAHRLVAIRTVGITRAAEQLGMSHSSLSEWIARRTLDLADDGEDNEPE